MPLAPEGGVTSADRTAVHVPRRGRPTDREHEGTLTQHWLSPHETVQLRLLGRGETALVQDVFDQMSDRSRFLRFHAATPRLTSRAIRHLSSVEAGRHVVVVATLHGRGIGLARWVRLRHEPSTAELAAAVSDAYQGRGLGKALVGAAAVSALTAGVSRFMASVHPENRRVRDALHAAGARSLPGARDDVFLPVAALTG